MKKKLNKKKDTIYDHVTKNNAISSLILPLLKRLKYDHEKIKKPKPDIFINIKSDEIYDHGAAKAKSDSFIAPGPQPAPHVPARCVRTLET